jgi:Protein of unknown function (DUF2909)
MIKIIVIIFILAILFSLGSALYYMLTQKKSPQLMVKALSWRIGLSIALFLLLLIAFIMGWIHPHPI